MSESGKRVLLLLDGVVNAISKNKGVDKALAKILHNRRHITADGGDEGSFSPCVEPHISDGCQYYYQRKLVGLYYDITHSMLTYKQIDRALVTSYR